MSQMECHQLMPVYFNALLSAHTFPGRIGDRRHHSIMSFIGYGNFHTAPHAKTMVSKLAGRDLHLAETMHFGDDGLRPTRIRGF